MRTMRFVIIIGSTVAILAIGFGISRKGQQASLIERQSCQIPLEARYPISYDVLSKPSGPEQSSFKPNEVPFYGPVRLSNGRTVQLRFVQCLGPQNRQAWLPNGNPVIGSDLDRILDLGPQDRKERRVMLLRVDVDMAPDEFDCLVRVPHKSGWNIYQTYADVTATHFLDMVSFQAPNTMKTSDVGLELGFGPFKDYVSSKIGGGILVPHVSNQASPAVTTIFGHNCQITCAISVRIPPSLEGKDIRLDAFDSSGKKTETRAYTPESIREPDDPNPRRTFLFGDLQPEAVRYVTLTVRDFEWVTFTGVHLWPNVRS